MLHYQWSLISNYIIWIDFRYKSATSSVVTNSYIIWNTPLISGTTMHIQSILNTKST